MVTIKDIAKQLGIAPSTVSRALHDHYSISKKTKDKVLKVAKELNYEPNKVALSLKNKSTKIIGVIIPEIVHFFFSNVIAGIEEVAYDNDYTVMFCQSNELYEKEVKDIYALLSHRVDGLLISQSKATFDFAHYHEVKKRNIPLVFFDRAPIDIIASKVLIDDYQGSKEAVSHLVQTGCKNILHIASNLHLDISINRKKGYEDSLRNHRIVVNPELIVDSKAGNEEAGFDIVNELLAKSVEIDGIFASNDLLALGAIKAVRESGRLVPKDVKVVGFGDWNFCSMMEPTLTSVSQPGIEMGRIAMEKLLEAIKSKNEVEPNTTILTSTLLKRNSTN